MLDIPWFSQHLNYQGFVTDCQTLFGENSVSVFKYQGDVVQEVTQKLGLATAHDNPTPRQNQSVNAVVTKLLRTINQYNIKAKDKELLSTHFKEINRIFDNYPNDSLIDESAKNKVLALFKPVKVELKINA